MKLNAQRIGAEGWRQQEEIDPKELDLDVDLMIVEDKVIADVIANKYTNTINVEINLTGSFKIICCRCLCEVKKKFEKSFNANYTVDRNNYIIDLNPEIRENIILDYPVNPLCHLECKGICQKCGADLNKEKCTCSK